MLSAEDNEILTRVGGGTPMGDLLRRYWTPFLFGTDLTPDGPPKRVRVLGEDLLAFRGADGEPGLIAERCPHRRASLYFGRNEGGAMRCIYHGWAFDRDGRCVDQPSEPERSTFKDKVRTAAYPVRERGGVLWAYLGPASDPPALPHFEWMDLPPAYRVLTRRVQYCNWAQAIEGEFDQSHVSFAHAMLDGGTDFAGSAVDAIRAADKHPVFEVVPTDVGVCIAAGRTSADGVYWRITQHLMPYYSMTGPYGPDPRRLNRMWVPMDDTNVVVFGVMYHPARPLTQADRDFALLRSNVSNIAPQYLAPATSAPYGDARPLATLENDFFQDRELQRTRSFSGIPEFWAQDAAPQLSMGEICDRTQEHLGTSDMAIIAIRKRLIAAAKALRDEDRAPEESRTPDAYYVRGDAVMLPAGEPWFAATAERRTVTPACNPDAP